MFRSFEFVNFFWSTTSKGALKSFFNDICSFDLNIFAFGQNNNSHFELIISSSELKKLKPIDAHKKIYTILDEEMKNIIHSLEIKIN